jgi:hypothetical protein
MGMGDVYVNVPGLLSGPMGVCTGPSLGSSANWRSLGAPGAQGRASERTWCDDRERLTSCCWVLCAPRFPRRRESLWLAIPSW